MYIIYGKGQEQGIYISDRVLLVDPTEIFSNALIPAVQVDVAGLSQQVMERREQEDLEKQRHEAFGTCLHRAGSPLSNKAGLE